MWEQIVICFWPRGSFSAGSCAMLVAFVEPQIQLAIDRLLPTKAKCLELMNLWKGFANSWICFIKIEALPKVWFLSHMWSELWGLMRVWLTSSCFNSWIWQTLLLWLVCVPWQNIISTMCCSLMVTSWGWSVREQTLTNTSVLPQAHPMPAHILNCKAATSIVRGYALWLHLKWKHLLCNDYLLLPVLGVKDVILSLHNNFHYLIIVAF